MLEDVQDARAGLLSVPRVIVASNGSVIARYHSDPGFAALIDAADVIDPDGMPLILATRLLWKRPLPERVATTDFIHDACEIAIKNGLRFYFLGGKPGVAERAAERLRTLHPGIQIVGTRHGYFRPDEEEEVCEAVRETGADVLWLGLGSPAQESFAVRRRASLAGVGWIRTCGGLFDHYTGLVPRAPRWMQNAGLEWLHRSMLEPARLGVRYLRTNPAAVWHLLTKSRERG
ncbi:glycosyltransferase [Sphingomonas deserti]|uniref:Glycosyltransferase n=1 Tax=Allosphingosinicella deserti TaxID=2116704 RepID=A0A2P7QKS2_9SPHN|nr:glycosyltransferase [Sphingomonas deserti]